MEYNDGNRGRIQFRNRARQIIDFRGIRYGKITPTDIDGLIEYRRLGAYALFEFKHVGAEVPDGQESAFKEMVDDFRKAGKQAILFICEHNIDDPEQDIIAAETAVKEIYWNGKFYPQPEKKRTLKVMTDDWFAYVERKREKRRNA